MTTPDICRCCHQEPTRLRCACCGMCLCRGCAVSTGEGEYCPDCHSDMLCFLADVEVSDVAQVPQHGQEQLPRPA